MRFDPLLRHTYEDASCILGIAPYVGSFLAGLAIQRLEVLSETGLETLPGPVDRAGRTGPVRLLYVGRIVRTKGVRDAIRAMAQLRDLSLAFDIVGDGFDRATCQGLALELGVADRVVFHGRLARAEVDRFYRNADIFVFPSYREPGGNAVFEAMGWGLPLVVCDRGGPAAAVDENSALRITPLDPRQFAAALADAIRRLATDSALRLRLGGAARVRVGVTALWDQKVDLMEKLYYEVLDRVASAAGTTHPDPSRAEKLERAS
jgi:glycosyltransferase involved in cell wall biosynthesis